MRASDDGRLCLEAEVYYYDLLCRQDVTVPQSVREHVKACPACQGQIRRLQGILSEAEKGDDSAGSSADDEMVEALARQFGLLDEQVTCSHVKSFLPSLLDPARAIRIPTPVTVHLDHCPQCIEDLAAIRALNLTAEQLKRLGRLFEPPDLRESQKCRRARPAVAALGSFSLADAGAEALSHVSTCPQCRAKVYRERERHRHAAMQNAGDRKATTCHAASRADIFDLVVPYAPASADTDAPGERQKAATAHIRACPTCMERVQALHRTICDIAERIDSGTATVYHVQENARNVAEGIEDTPCRYPIDVQVLDCGPGPTTDRAVPPSARAAAGGSPVRWYPTVMARAALVAAAGIVLVIILWMHGARTASGTNDDDVLKVLENAQNVHVVTRAAVTMDLVEELWVARPLNLMVRKTKRECILYDFDHGQRTMRDPQTGIGAPVRLEKRQGEMIRRRMTGCVGDAIVNVSPENKLVDPPGVAADGATAGLDVYELTPTGYTHGSRTPSSRWRVFIDRATGLPQRQEYDRRAPTEDQWRLSTITTFEYFTEQQMQDSIEAMFPVN